MKVEVEQRDNCFFWVTLKFLKTPFSSMWGWEVSAFVASCFFFFIIFLYPLIQTHRMARVGRDFKDHQVLIPKYMWQVFSLEPGELPEQGDRFLEEVTALRAEHLNI